LYLGAGKFTPSQDHLNESASISAASKRKEMAQVTNIDDYDHWHSVANDGQDQADLKQEIRFQFA